MPVILKRQTILKEYRMVGRYKVRLIQPDVTTQDKRVFLDVREYLNSETFQGFTRRGAQFAGLAEVEALLDVLLEVRADMKAQVAQ